MLGLLALLVVAYGIENSRDLGLYVFKKSTGLVVDQIKSGASEFSDNIAKKFSDLDKDSKVFENIGNKWKQEKSKVLKASDDQEIKGLAGRIFNDFMHEVGEFRTAARKKLKSIQKMRDSKKEMASPKLTAMYHSSWGDTYLQATDSEMVEGVWKVDDERFGVIKGRYNKTKDAIEGWWCDKKSKGLIVLQVVRDQFGKVKALDGDWRYEEDKIWSADWDLSKSSKLKPSHDIVQQLKKKSESCSSPDV